MRIFLMPTLQQHDGARCRRPSFFRQSPLQAIWALLLLMTFTTQGCGIYSHGNSAPVGSCANTLPADFDSTDSPDYEATFRQDDPDTMPQPSAQFDVMLDQGQPTSLAELEALFQEALSRAGADELDRAQDDLMALEEQYRLLSGADNDSCTRQRLESLHRRGSLLRAIMVEENSFASESCEADLLLAAGYRNLAGQFPDSLMPATGLPMPGIMADLLKWDNHRVDKWLDYFTGRGRTTFTLWLQRKQEVGGFLESILEDEGLPRQLVYLAMIESGFSPHAKSVVSAVGPWQFMAPTARAQGLRINWWVDERRDYELSTRAAARYLKSLHDTFGDWSLVLAAYNSGENRVRRKINLRASDNYWDLNLPEQTADFVPKFIAAARIGEDPASYGFETNPVEPLDFDTITIAQPTGLDLLARCAGTKPQVLANLNPALLRGATPPDMGPYPVHVPKGSTPVVTTALAKVPASERLTWTRHRVRRGETLSGIASRYGCSVRDLARVNHMHDIQLIRPGDQLLIPMPAALDRLARKRAVEKGHYVPPAGYKRISYKVKPGDTLGGIARKLGVSVTHLRRVNNIHHTSLIHPGDRLYAYRPSR